MAKLLMQKISVTALKKDQKKLMALLQRMGCIHITGALSKEEEPLFDVAFDQASIDALQEQIALITQALERLAQLAPEKKSMLAQPPAFSSDDLAALYAQRDGLVEVCESIRGLDGENAQNRSAILRLQAQMQTLNPIAGFKMALQDIEDTEFVSAGLFSVENRNVQAFDEMAPSAEGFYFEEAGRSSDAKIYFVLWHKQAQDALELFCRYDLKRLGFQETGTPAQAIDAYKREIEQIEEKIDENIQTIIAFAPRRGELEALYDILVSELDKERAAQLFAGTHEAFMAQGWVEEQSFDTIKQTLERDFSAIYITKEEPLPGEEAPIYTKNNKVVEPYEFITNMFTAPSNNDIDPNAVMMPFFLAFFGMMLSDAGYGILLSVLAVLGLKVFKFKGGIGQICKILVLGGVFTVIAGAMYGTWFGYELPPLLFSPLEQPLETIMLCLALGGLHLISGMVINTVQQIKRGQILDAIGGQISWFFVFAGIALLAILPNKTVGGIVIGIGAVLLLLFSNNEAGWNIGKRVFSGLGALYNITGYLSDLLSYLRLFAMGLATGVIGMVVNIIVGMLMESAATAIFGIAVFVVGHLFNLAINALGAYVHSSRLQYIEFYGKFYEGGGELFTPLSRRPKYIEIKD